MAESDHRTEEIEQAKLVAAEAARAEAQRQGLSKSAATEGAKNLVYAQLVADLPRVGVNGDSLETDAQKAERRRRLSKF